MPQIDEKKLTALLEKMTGDIAAAMSSGLVYIGQKLGLYKAMVNAGPLTSAEIAERTETVERYIREWLINQTACGYVEYDPQTDKYTLPAEQALLLCDEEHPFFVSGFFSAKAVLQAVNRVADSFRKGGGVPWNEQDPDLFVGTELSFRPFYLAYLTNTWIPALNGINEKLRSGGKIADIGCGRGASSLIMARGYPNSHVFGFDYHEPSIVYARDAARRSGVAARTTFGVANSDNFPDGSYDLITFCICLHDMPDPIGAAKRAFETLQSDGSVMIVETMAGNSVQENCNPIGQIFSAVSTLCCLTNSIAQGGSGLGAVATEQAIKDVVMAAGFSSFRRIGESLLTRVYEAKK
jgi:2-polyprenyl-3-methyl-5-hydroxy-6-metoxy-1,4-benzoquinol methylase